MIDLIRGDSSIELRELKSESVDLLVTDPPYGISFMGKDWDRALPDKQVWVECLRVLKPGAFAFVMSIPRSDCLSRMIISLEDAGFLVNFTPIFWAYASGFPKAQNIGKAVDRRNGRIADEYKALGNYLKTQRGNRPQKDISKFFPSKTGGLTGCVANWELGFNVPTKAQWAILHRELNLDNRFNELIEREEAEREIIGRHPTIKGHGSVFNMEFEGYPMITAPATPQAKALDGSYGGFQPKPAVEVIIVCMKPLSEKTFVDQALKNKKGITWLDDGRIPYDKDDDALEKGLNRAITPRADITGGRLIGYGGRTKVIPSGMSQSGRFPSNLLVSDDVLNDGRITKSAVTIQPEFISRNVSGFQPNPKAIPGYNQHRDSGSFSRYFDLDKWAQKTFPFLIVPKASKSEKNRGCEDLPQLVVSGETNEFGKMGINTPEMREKRGVARALPRYGNPHPTVKPLKLMSYLITLGSRVGDTVLDPFIGSGTTAVACKMLGRNCVGIDIAKDYCEIAQRRVGVVAECLV